MVITRLTDLRWRLDICASNAENLLETTLLLPDLLHGFRLLRIALSLPRIFYSLDTDMTHSSAFGKDLS